MDSFIVLDDLVINMNDVSHIYSADQEIYVRFKAQERRSKDITKEQFEKVKIYS